MLGLLMGFPPSIESTQNFTALDLGLSKQTHISPSREPLFISLHLFTLPLSMRRTSSTVMQVSAFLLLQMSAMPSYASGMASGNWSEFLRKSRSLVV